MKSSKTSIHFRQCFAVTLVCVLTIALLHPPQSRTQSSGCPSGSGVKYPPNSKVYYTIDTTITSATEKTQIANAVAAWNSANQANGSGVQFLPGPPPSGTNNPPTLVFKNGPLGGPGARENHEFDLTTGLITSATITFDLNATLPNTGAAFYLEGAVGYDTIFEKVGEHEIGHLMGEQDAPGQTDVCNQPDGATVMNGSCGTNDSQGNMPTNPTDCDKQTVSSNYSPTPGGGGGPADCTACFDIIGCLECDSNQANCPCTLFNPYSPIILDVDRDGYDLTDLWGGVRFDLDVKGRPGFTAWTAGASDDAFLVLDRNGNGVIDDGRELFGNATPLGNGVTAANGWDALAVFDQGDHGGNGDGLIDARDAIYSLLRLWQDLNHNGISESEEVHKLPELGIDVISLDYQQEGRRDRNGNLFRFRSRIQGHDQVTGKNYQSFAFDVFFGIPGHTSSPRQ